MKMATAAVATTPFKAIVPTTALKATTVTIHSSAIWVLTPLLVALAMTLSLAASV